MADPMVLKVAQRLNNRDNNLLQIVLFPKDIPLLPVPKHDLHVLPLLHVLANQSDPVGVVHSLIKVVAVELDRVRVGLDLRELDGFFLK
jgi:hypothetical protein